MTDYSQLSDFEINKRVAISIGFPCYYGDGSYTNNLGLKGAIVKGESNSGLFMVGEFNPCNNPADAWPIISGHNIAIAPYKNALPQAWSTAFGMVSKFNFEDANPLRAAMIVFLMMKENAN